MTAASYDVISTIDVGNVEIERQHQLRLLGVQALINNTVLAPLTMPV